MRNVSTNADVICDVKCDRTEQSTKSADNVPQKLVWMQGPSNTLIRYLLNVNINIASVLNVL